VIHFTKENFLDKTQSATPRVAQSGVSITYKILYKNVDLTFHTLIEK